MKIKNKKHLMIILCAVLIFPAINVLIVRGLGLYFLTEPLKYPSLFPAILGLIYEYVSGVLTFFPPLCIAYAITSEKCVAATCGISVLAVPGIYTLRVLEDIFINGQTLVRGSFKTALFDWLSVLVCYCLVAAAAVLILKCFKRSDTETELFSLKGTTSKSIAASVAITFAVSAVQSAAETYVAVKEAGAPTDLSSAVDLASPYIVLIIEAFIAYVAAYFVIKRQEGSHTAPALRK